MQFIIFSIKKEIASQYYYKVDLMKRFFEEILNNPQSFIYIRQLSYITDLFPFQEWLEEHSPVKKQVKNNVSYRSSLFEKALPYGIMEPKNYCCLFQCDNLLQAEQMVFDPLRKSSHAFYIMEATGEYYGWISPKVGQRLLS
ncbi:sporulation inhibitor of replication protein SirA [Halobacillus yeomjeoni]|uniref:Sporulation inhibitor of replication protein SirA n=1 Tax=Halobacillus yeomjeoni TaxID=311194 RepID=A0A931HTZ1_9BACI|nr:sporulation inhibitor of replication protein SirA [Halobacillus yeomjeoni]MBH0229401.1 sporulation inhibitor of replication protein SirA [Halobacillus yeomjeoni]